MLTRPSPRSTHYDEQALPALPALPANGAALGNGAPAAAPAKKAAVRRKPKASATAAITAVSATTATVEPALPPLGATSAAVERGLSASDRAVNGAGAAAFLPVVEGGADLGGLAASHGVHGNEAEGAQEDAEDQEVYCFCQTPSYGEMIGCDRDECEKAWFHLPCVGLKVRVAPRDADPSSKADMESDVTNRLSPRGAGTATIALLS